MEGDEKKEQGTGGKGREGHGDKGRKGGKSVVVQISA